MTTDALLDRARDWLAHDPDPASRAELGALVAARSPALAERFAGPLVFGTAGLRGILGAGESRMNRAVVRRTSAGLGRHLCGHDPGEPGARARAATAHEARPAGETSTDVVVGHDGRRLGRELAEDTAAVLCAAGLRVHLSRSVCPTPLVAFAVTRLGARAGVMVTASHNPPEYNGYKVYADNGAQIIPPADQLIAAASAAAPPADQVPLASLAEARASGMLHELGAALERSYLDSVAALVPTGTGNRGLSIVYTPLHGVGNALFRQAMAEAGFTNVFTVPEQAEPDGDFPTVVRPNPEEPGTLDRALAAARERSAALLLANDPDADRLAVAVRDRAGEYVALSGNEVGILLGHAELQRDRDRRRAGDGPPLVVTTIVSTPLLAIMAHDLGAGCELTLTGFKWIANRAMARERADGARFLFGFEEALGYTLGTAVRDKDGISAAVRLATLAAERHAEGESLRDELARIYRRYGLFASRQHNLELPGIEGRERMAAIMAALREHPPAEIGGRSVRSVSDYARSERRGADGSPSAIDLPPSDVLAFELDGGHRVVARPSGTEPKIKLYFDVREPLGRHEPLSLARARAAQRLDALVAALLARIEAR